MEIPVLKLKRCSWLAPNLDEALSVMSMTQMVDGEMIIASYTDSNDIDPTTQEAKIKTVFAIKNQGQKTYFNSEGQEIEELDADKVVTTPIEPSEETVGVTGDTLPEQIASIAKTIKEVAENVPTLELGDGLIYDDNNKLTIKLDSIQESNGLSLGSDGLTVALGNTLVKSLTQVDVKIDNVEGNAIQGSEDGIKVTLGDGLELNDNNDVKIKLDLTAPDNSLWLTDDGLYVNVPDVTGSISSALQPITQDISNINEALTGEIQRAVNAESSLQGQITELNVFDCGTYAE